MSWNPSNALFRLTGPTARSRCVWLNMLLVELRHWILSIGASLCTTTKMCFVISDIWRGKKQEKKLNQQTVLQMLGGVRKAARFANLPQGQASDIYPLHQLWISSWHRTQTQTEQLSCPVQLTNSEHLVGRRNIRMSRRTSQLCANAGNHLISCNTGKRKPSWPMTRSRLEEWKACQMQLHTDRTIISIRIWGLSHLREPLKTRR